MNKNQRSDHTNLKRLEMVLMNPQRLMLSRARSALYSQSKMLYPAYTMTSQLLISHNKCYATKSKNEKQNLLRFPAMPLNETLDRFLKTAEPLLDKKELEETKKALEIFCKEEGPELQNLLQKAAEFEENWLANRWLRVAYLQYRDPVTVYSSPGMSFPLTVFKNIGEYAYYTGCIVYGLAKYKQLIDCGDIPVVKMGKLELDNSQFGKVFGTCRIPAAKEDLLKYNPTSKHVVVIYKNHFYKMSVYNKSGQPVHPQVFAAQFQKIMNMEKELGVAYGVLSTDHRDNWAESYMELIKIGDNKFYVDIIQKSLFTVSLDECVDSKQPFNTLSEQLIHGGGIKQNSANRWMDKTIQVIVNPNGMSGFCYEHSPAEGQPIALMTDYITKNRKNENFFEGAAKDNYDDIEKLCLKSSGKLDKYIAKAVENVNKLACNLDINILHYKSYGKGFIKKQKLSPDSYIQIALQYAYYKMYCKAVAQYESAHLRIYYDGRTETIRSCSNESVAFAAAMLNKDCDDKQRVELLKKAVNSHREYTNLALQGKGVDRHLLGLKLMAIENKKPIPEFFKSPGVIKSAIFRMSTSQVASANESFMSYGPSQPDGYACCYNPREEDIILAVTAWKDNKETDAVKFTKTLSDALAEMCELLSRAGTPPKSKL